MVYIPTIERTIIIILMYFLPILHILFSFMVLIVSCNVYFCITYIFGIWGYSAGLSHGQARYPRFSLVLWFPWHCWQPLFQSGFLLPAQPLAPNLSECCPWCNHVPEFYHFGTRATVWRLSFFGQTDSLSSLELWSHLCLGVNRKITSFFSFPFPWTAIHEVRLWVKGEFPVGSFRIPPSPL